MGSKNKRKRDEAIEREKARASIATTARACNPECSYRIDRLHGPRMYFRAFIPP